MLTGADPPTWYRSRPVDIWGGLDYLEQQASENKYASQYEFDTAMFDLMSSVHDGHLSVLGCSLSVFSFSAGDALVSISRDGLELPEIYNYRMSTCSPGLCVLTF